MERIGYQFRKLIIESAVIAGPTDSLVGFVDYQVTTDGGALEPAVLSSRIRATPGAEAFQEVEVEPPPLYSGPFHHQILAQGVREYLDELIGPEGIAFRIPPGAKLSNVILEEITIEHDMLWWAKT